MELVPLASMVLLELLHAFRPKEFCVSSYGIREGMLYEQMPDRLRRRDPLIEAARYSERTMARVPGFGKKNSTNSCSRSICAPPRANCVW